VSATDGKRLHAADPLRASAEHAAAAALRELPEALSVVFDRELRFVVTAGPALERLGDPGVCVEGRSVGEALPADVWCSLEPLFRSALDGETRSREIWTVGRERCLLADVGPLGSGGPHACEDAHSGSGLAAGVAVVRDVTARRHAELIAAPPPPGGFEEVFERAPIGTALLDADGRWLLVNRALCDITGYTAEELIGKRADGIMHAGDVEDELACRQRLLAGEIPAFQIEARYFDAAGEVVSAILSMSLVRDRDGAPLHFIAQLHDISERRQLEEDLRRLADHDPLTGLRNSRLFGHDLKLQVARSERYGEVAGLVVIELDAFGLLTASHGAEVGERMLKAVARALTRRLRETDLVARLGGGEFAVLLPHIDGEGLAVVADGLARVVPACSVDTGEEILHPHLGVGFAIIDQATVSAEQALAEARRARRRGTSPPQS